METKQVNRPQPGWVVAIKLVPSGVTTAVWVTGKKRGASVIVKWWPHPSLVLEETLGPGWKASGLLRGHPLLITFLGKPPQKGNHKTGLFLTVLSWSPLIVFLVVSLHASQRLWQWGDRSADDFHCSGCTWSFCFFLRVVRVIKGDLRDFETTALC